MIAPARYLARALVEATDGPRVGVMHSTGDALEAGPHDALSMIPNAKASVLLGHGQFMLASVSRTVKGIWVVTDPFGRVPDTASDAELGAAIRRVLEGSRVGVDHPANVSVATYGRPFVRAMGFRTATELFRGGLSISARVDGDRLRAFPSRADKKGNVLFTGESVWSRSLADEDVGRTIREALARSSPSPN